MADHSNLTRRDLIRNSAATAGAVALAGPGVNLALGQTAGPIRVGVVGCGGQGTAAAKACVKAAEGVKVTALADAFQDQLQELKTAFGVPDNRCFTGLEGYKKLMALGDVDLVIIATPAGLRPLQIAEAVAQGKHVYADAPVAVCPAGIAMVADAAAKAAEKGLAIIAAPLQRRDVACIETMSRILDGAIGTIVSAQFYHNGPALPVVKRKPGQSDVEWQVRNWHYFTWLSGGIVLDRLVPSLDILNWGTAAMPDTVHAIGGRQFHTSPDYGNIYDHVGIEFFYPGSVGTIGMARGIDGTDVRVADRLVGTKGVSNGRGLIEGENAWIHEGPRPDPCTQALAELIQSVRSGKPVNDVQTGTDATLCAVMARESAYSRQQFKRSWFISKSKLNLLPDEGLQLSSAKPIDPVAHPDKYELSGWRQEPKTKKKRGKKKK